MGYTHISGVPLEVTWKGQWKPFTFDVPNLSHDEAAGTVNMVGLVWHYIYQLQNIKSGFN